MAARIHVRYCVSDKEAPICHSSSYKNVLEKMSTTKMLQVVRQNSGGVGIPTPTPGELKGRCWELHCKGKGAGLEIKCD